MNLESYNLKAEKLKDVEFHKVERERELSPQLIKDYIVAYRRNQRQWSASTKGRSEVNHSQQKPHRQKGTGKARQGSLASPQYKGGGVVFGPRPKFDQHIRINQKEKRAVIQYLIEKKIEDKKLIILDKTEMEAPRTKVLAAFIEKRGLDKRTLFIAETADQLEKEKAPAKSSHLNFKKSIHNLKKVEFSLVSQMNGYQLLKAEHVVMTQAGLKQYMEFSK